MAWARLDDGWHDHPKIIEAGWEAAGFWVACLTSAYRARRTTDHPGVIPAAVVVRLAGGKATAKRLTKRLHAVRLLDDETSEGWPIHDFEDYLPKYDTEQAKAAGARGGSARAAKQTASKPLSEPPDGTEAVGQANSSTRASARRNPVPTPKPEEPSGSPSDVGESSVTRAPATDAGRIVAAWSDACRANGFSPIGDQATIVGRQAKEALDEGNEFGLVLEAALLAAADRIPWVANKIGPAVAARQKAAANQVSPHDPIWGNTLGGGSS